MNGIDFDRLERKYNRKLRLRNLAIFLVIYAVLLVAAHLLTGAAVLFAVPLLVAWAVTWCIVA